MMNELHKLMDYLEKDGLRTNFEISDIQTLQCKQEIVMALNKAIIFEIDDASMPIRPGEKIEPNFKEIVENSPYNNFCLVLKNYDNKENVNNYILVDKKEENVILYMIMQGFGKFILYSITIVENNGAVSVFPGCARPPHSIETASDISAVIISHLKTFISLLECNNIYIKNNKPSELKQRLQKKKKKTPLFEYKTLHIKTPNQNTINITGNKSDRAGPRVHLRRGHIRHYANGTCTWVQQCVVGNKKNGVIHKDYSL